MAYGVILGLGNGMKVVYSGDCRPTVELNDTYDTSHGSSSNSGGSGGGDGGNTGSSGYSDGNRRSKGILLKYAKDCDLLIHEATFDDSMSSDAQTKKHSTVSEAVTVGNILHAKTVLLTHFSQRYPKLMGVTAKSKQNNSNNTNDMNDTALMGQENTIFAFDLLNFKVSKQHSMKNKSSVDNLISTLQLIENNA